MKKMIIAMGILAAVACNNAANDKKDGASGASGSYQTSGNVYMDIAGIYSDTLPCADCSGILTEVIIKPDTTFELRERHLNADGRPAKSSSQKGIYSFTEDGKKLKLTHKDDGGNPRVFEIQKDALLASNAQTGNGSDMSLEMREKIIGKVGGDFVSYRLLPFKNYPAQVISHIVGMDITINKPYLDVAKDAEKAIIAYYGLQYNGGCDAQACALFSAMNMDETQATALVKKWMPSVNLPSAEEMRKTRTINLAMLFFVQNGNSFQANYNVMTADREMSHAADEFEITETEVKLIKKGDVVVQSKPQHTVQQNPKSPSSTAPNMREVPKRK